ncbi:MAG: class B sortase [Oscillospiraceae bacterium]|nr:class B sortase [Oscillospiraceae bacterium]
MATASYDSRPHSSNMYKDGKKRNIFVRLLMWLFPCKGDGAFEVMRKLCFLIALGCLIYFGGSVVIDLGNDLYQEWKITQKIKDWDNGVINLSEDEVRRVLEREPEILPDYMEWFNMNPDLVGHIRLPDLSAPGTFTIDYPVVQSYDNEHYLETAFDGSYSKGGSILADWRNRFEHGELSGNTILYGHNMTTGNYFTMLTRYYSTADDLSFYKRHPVVTFNTIYEKSEWKVFAVVLFNTQEQYGEVYNYNFPEFRDKDDFNTFILDIMDRSVIFTDVDLTYGDHILTLSTCYYPFTKKVDTRCAVFARKVREGESPIVNTDKAKYNPNVYQFEEQRRRIGNTWYGRTWDTSYLLSYESGE